MSSNSHYIDGIYNYCDCWCERCAFTARCRTFAMEQEFERAEEEGRDPHEIDWEAFWRRVGLSFDRTPTEWLEEFDDVDPSTEFDLGISFVETDSDDWLDEKTDEHPLVVRAHDYREATHQWLRQHSKHWSNEAAADRSGFSPAPLAEHELEIQDAIAVIGWYHTLIAAKLDRAVSGLLENELNQEPWNDSSPEVESEEEDLDAIIRETTAYDAAGSAKVALISIERSIGAWTALRSAHPELTRSIAPLQRLLGWLRVTTDRLLPDARTFHRPGFDDP